MSYRIRVSSQAAAQIRDAADWWFENRPKAPEALDEEIERSFDLLCALPSAGEPVAHSAIEGLRRILLGRVHYHLYYSASRQTETVEILALWHTSRGTVPPL